MQILLAVVPQCDVETHPLLALPALAGNLAFNGYRDVEQVNFAVDIDEWFASHACVEQTHAKVVERLAELAARPSLSDDEATLYTRLKLADETYELKDGQLPRTEPKPAPAATPDNSGAGR